MISTIPSSAPELISGSAVTLMLVLTLMIVLIRHEIVGVQQPQDAVRHTQFVRLIVVPLGLAVLANAIVGILDITRGA